MLKPSLKKLGFAILMASSVIYANLSVSVGGVAGLGIRSGKMGAKGKLLPHNLLASNDDLQDKFSMLAYNAKEKAPEQPLATAEKAADGVETSTGRWPSVYGSGVPGRAFDQDPDLEIDDDPDTADGQIGYNNAANKKERLAQALIKSIQSQVSPLAALLKAGNQNWSKSVDFDSGDANIFETEADGFARSLRFMLEAIVKYSIDGTPFAIGGAFNIGVSFIKLKAKNLDGAEFTDSEQFFMKAAIVVGVTEYLEMHGGLGVSRHTIEYIPSNNLKTQFSAYNTALSDADTVAESFANYKNDYATESVTTLEKLRQYLTPITVNNLKSSNWVFDWFIKAVGVFKLNNNIAFTAGIGIDFPLTGKTANDFFGDKKHLEGYKSPDHKVIIDLGARCTL